MKKELIGLGLVLSAIVLSESAFTRPVRKQIGNRDHWKCTEPGCKKGVKTGWRVEANHTKPTFEGGVNRASNGSMKCLEHHYYFHKRRGDTGAANLIWSRIQNTFGGRTPDWIRMHKKK